MIKQKEKLYQIFRFGIVGCLNTVITIGIFTLLHQVLGVFYLISSIIGYTFGIINSFFWNKYWTFKRPENKITKEFPKFLVLNLVGLGLNSVFITVFVEIIKIAPLPGQFLAILFVFTVNFIGSKFWVFK